MRKNEVIIVITFEDYPDAIEFEKYFRAKQTTNGVDVTHYWGSAHNGDVSEDIIADLEGVGCNIHNESSQEVKEIYGFIPFQSVFATVNGTQYHIGSCHFVVNKTNLREFSTKQQAIDAGLSNCDSCLG